MASKRRLRRKSCEGKVQYRSDEAAAAAAKSRSWATNSRIGKYKCEFGQHWHIGHTPKSVQRHTAARRAGAFA